MEKEQIIFTKEDIKDGIPFAVLSYIFFLWILTYIYRQDNEFAKYHARYGMVLFLFFIIFTVFSVLPIIGKMFFIIGFVGYFSLSLYCIFCALNGKTPNIPILDKLTDRLSI